MEAEHDNFEVDLELNAPRLPVVDLARPERRRSPWWRNPLILWPARVLVSGMTLVGGAVLGSKSAKSKRALLASGATALGVSHVLLRLLSQLRDGRQLGGTAKQKRAAAEVSRRMGWNEALSAVWRILCSFQDGMAVPITLSRVLRDAEVMKQHHMFHYEKTCGDLLPPSSDHVLIAGRHFASFAMASYGFILLKLFGLLEETYDMFTKGSHPVDVVMHQVGLDYEDILLADLDGEHLGIPRHFVARDASTKSIVITVRGTSSLSDVIMDLLCESAPFGDGYAHSGMKDAAYSLYYAILPTILSALEENEGYKVVTVGHSLGAGVAILLTKILLDNGFKGVKCYAISPPRVYGPMHAIDPDWSDALECFINEDDIVPRLSVQSARALAAEMEDINKVPAPSSRDELTASLSDESLLPVREHNKKPQAESTQIFSPLYIPTNRGVHWLLPHTDAEEGEADIAYRAVFASVSLFNRILVTPNCVTSHFPSRYMAAFNALPLPPVLGPNRSASDLNMPCSIFQYGGELGF